jgi:hypothetical protein
MTVSISEQVFWVIVLAVCLIGGSALYVMNLPGAFGAGGIAGLAAGALYWKGKR